MIYDMSDYEISLPVDVGILTIKREPSNLRLVPFQTAAFTALPFLIFSILLCAYSISLSIYLLMIYEDLFFIGQNLILIISISFSVLATLIYVFMTVFFLEGGYYIDGVWLNVFGVLLGLLCVLISLSIESKASHQSRYSIAYLSIDQT